MKVLHLTLSLRGGAGIACRRLHASLKKLGVDSVLLAADGEAGDDVLVCQPRLWRWRAHVDRLLLKRYPRRRIFAWWSNNTLPSSVLRKAAQRVVPDIVHVHWIGDGWINPRDVARAGRPVVWTLHDTWAFTGGCHYPAACERFTAHCGACPQLDSTDAWDLSARNFERKSAAWRSVRPLFVAPSRWIASLASRSGVARDATFRVIPNGLDSNVFFPANRGAARVRLGLSERDLAVLAFASGDVSDVRKGSGLIAPALARAAANASRSLRLVVVGPTRAADYSSDAIRIPRIEHDAALVDVYSAADVHLLPTLQDNLPNTALEALACGCPVIAPAVGGLGEIVEPGRSGWLAAAPTIPALARTLEEFAGLPAERRDALRQSTRAVFLERFNAADRAADHVEVYRAVVEKR